MYYENNFILIENKSHQLTSPLTGKEDIIVGFLIENYGKVLEKSVIAEKAKVSYSKFNRGVDVHISNINKKLRMSKIPYVIYSVRGIGVLLKEIDKNAKRNSKVKTRSK